MRSRTTPTLAVTLCIGFAAQLWFDPQVLDGLRSVRVGSATRWLVAEGQIYRIGTALLLHAGWLHFLLTSALSVAWCAQIERQFDSVRAAAIALFSGLSSFLAVAAMDDAPTLGSSGITFGLIGGWAVLVAGSVPRGWLAAGIVATGMLIEALIPLDLPISTTVHLGGFVGGIITAGLLHPRGSLWETALPRVAVAVGIVIHLSLWGWGAVALSEWSDRDLFDTAPGLYERPDVDTGVVAAMAWEVLESPVATADDRAAALAGLESAIGRDPSSGDLRVMHGLLLERRGDLDAAIRELHVSLSLRPMRERAELLAAREVGVAAAAVPLDGILAQPNDEGTWDLEIGTTLRRGCEWHLLALEGDHPRAYMRLVLGSGSPGPLRLATASPRNLANVRWIATYEACSDVPADARDALYWELESATGHSHDP